MSLSPDALQKELCRRPANPKTAVELQRQASRLVMRKRTFGRLRTVAGVDVSYVGRRARGAVVVLSWPRFELLEAGAVEVDTPFPYIPGLLAFREVPVLLRVFGGLELTPDLVFVDGQGVAHPRRFGDASHLGVVLDLPTIGCGKSRLLGAHRDPGPDRGARTPLRHKGEVIGTVLRSRTGTKPIYVSIGHRIDLATAARLVTQACRTRVPEPIKLADRLSRRWRSNR